MLGAFLAVSILVIVTPGPDTALTIRNTLLGGRRSGVFTAVGVASGQAVWAIATSAGVAALLVASEPVFVALKLAGAVYLVFLGLHALHSAVRSGSSSPAAAGRDPHIATATALRHGLLSNLGNPKMAVFFTSLLPQFAPHGDPAFAQLLLLGLLFCSLTLGWLTLYAFVVAKAGDLLRRSVVRRAVEAITGAILVALGLRLAAESR